MEIRRVGAQPSAKGPSEWFTGTVRIDPLFQAPDPAFVQGASVTFEPGARTAWHTHPLGQTLIVTAGCGWAQRWGGPIEELRPGDVVWFSPGEKHWHGAAPATAMTHIAIQEKKRGKVVDWMEHVTDEQYHTGKKRKSRTSKTAMHNDALKDHLSTSREVRISVTGRKSGRTISIPVWFVAEDEKLYLLPARGSDTQWYKNALKSRTIRIDAGGTVADLKVAPITDAGQVSAVVDKFRAKYGNSGVRLYAKRDVAVAAQIG